MNMGHGQEEKRTPTEESITAMCNLFNQLYVQPQPIRLQSILLPTDRNDSGFGDEIRQLPSAHPSERRRIAGEVVTHRDPRGQAALSKEEIHALFGRDEDGDTLLHISILHGKESITFDIIQKAPDFTYLSIANDLNQTALHLAVLTRQPRVVRRLVCAGAATDAQDRCGNTALHLACAHGFYEIVQQLLKPVEYEETLSNNYRIPYQRIPQNMNVRNFEGFTCLHLAILNDHVEVFRMILDADIDINFGNGKNGRTALHLASEAGNVEMLSLLLQRGNIILDVTDFDGLTSFQLALGRGNADVQRLLILNGATYKTLNFEESDVDLRSLKEE